MSDGHWKIRDGILTGTSVVVEAGDTGSEATDGLRAILDGASPAGQVANIERLLLRADTADPLVLIRVEEIQRLLEIVKADLHDLPALDRAWSLLREAIVLPSVQTGNKVAHAHEKRDDFEDKPEFIKIVQRLNATLAHPRTCKEWEEHPELAPYARKYRGRHTLRDWINEALPGTLKTGRPRKHTGTG